MLHLKACPACPVAPGDGTGIGILTGTDYIISFSSLRGVGPTGRRQENGITNILKILLILSKSLLELRKEDVKP
jgi:hypothetical protein